MVELPKLDLIGFTTILAGFILLASGLLIIINTSVTAPDPINPIIIRILGIILAFVGVILFISRDE